MKDSREMGRQKGKQRTEISTCRREDRSATE